MMQPCWILTYSSRRNWNYLSISKKTEVSQRHATDIAVTRPAAAMLGSVTLVRTEGPIFPLQRGDSKGEVKICYYLDTKLQQGSSSPSSSGTLSLYQEVTQCGTSLGPELWDKLESPPSTPTGVLLLLASAPALCTPRPAAAPQPCKNHRPQSQGGKIKMVAAASPDPVKIYCS